MAMVHALNLKLTEFRRQGGAAYPATAFVTTWQTTSSPESITLPLYNTGTYNAVVDWGDGNTSTITAYDDADRVHTYAVAGVHTVVITGTLPGWSFASVTTSKDKVITVEQWGDVGFESLSFKDCSNLEIIAGAFTWPAQNSNYCFDGCDSLLDFPATIDMSASTSNKGGFRNSGFTSFPAIDLSGSNDVSFGWQNNASMATFGAVTLNASSVDINNAWNSCGITAFPTLDTSAVTSCSRSWYNCDGISTFPSIDLSTGTTFYQCWYSCGALSYFPANMFDSCTATNYATAFNNCTLSETSIDNILVSVDASGASGGTLDVGGGLNAPPSATGLAAKASLEGKGWTVNVNS